MKKISNFQFPISNSRKGFTVIELLIYTAIFAIVLSAATSLFFETRIQEVQIIQGQELERNGRVALLEMIQTIHAASSVTSPALGSSANNLYLNNNAIRYFINGGGILQKTESGQTTDLTSNEVSIQNLTFTTRGDAGKQPTVSVSFTVQSNTLGFNQATYMTKNFQTTAQLR